MIRYANPPLAALLKRNPAAREEVSFVSVFHPEGSAVLDGTAGIAVLDSEIPGRNFFALMRTGGQSRTVRLCFFPIRFRGKDAQLVVVDDDARFQRYLRKLQAYEREIRKLGAELLSVEERQRRQIALELHDGITQSLAVIRMQLSAFIHELDAPVLADRVEEIRSLVDETIEDTRRMVFELSPPILYGLSFEHVLRDLAEEFEHRYPITIGFSWQGDNISLNDDIQVFLFRTVRELLMNVIKHADADKVSIVCRSAPDRMEMEVSDNGKGIAPEILKKRSGFGLMSIRERTYSLGGRLNIESCPSGGTTVRLFLPIPAGTGKS